MRKYTTIVSIAMLLPFLSFAQTPVDSKATTKTKNLLTNLHTVADKGFMFGHQDDQAYGVGWHADEGESDVKAVVGKFPAVHGWDLGKDLTSDMNIDSVNYENMKSWIKATYKRGGLNSFSFHMDNLTTGGDSWDKSPSVADILPGGSKHSAFNEQLDLLAAFVKDCKKAPMVFRPWHEHNGNWFWWGKGNCTEEEYIALFRYTVDYLKNEKKIHNLLYAFSPDGSRWPLNDEAEQTYLYGYPGDDYVDIIGLDDYEHVGRNKSIPVEEQKKHLVGRLKIITKIAEERGKVAALTETGLESVANTTWFTDVILNPIKENQDEIKIAWLLVWRNSNLNDYHYYAPYPGHSSVPDFKTFEQDQFTYFESDLSNLYKKAKTPKK